MYTKRQLFEVLVDFWHNHFSVYAWDYAYASATWVHYDRDVIRAWLVGIASRFGNYRSFVSGPRVTVESMTAGGVGLAWSVLYAFFDEVDLDKPYASAGAPGSTSSQDNSL